MRRPAAAVVALACGVLLLCSACAGWGGGGAGGGGRSINVLMVNNPQMVDLQGLTADNFTKKTGIRVNFTVLPENDVRDKISQEFRYANTYPTAIGLVAAGRVDLDAIVSGHYALDEAEQALQAGKNDPQSVKAVVVPSQAGDGATS